MAPWVPKGKVVRGLGIFTSITSPVINTTSLVLTSIADALTAVGTTRATALVITEQINRITTAASGTGIVLPAGVPGQSITVINDGANPIKVYGNGSNTIDGVAGVTGVTLTNAKRATFRTIVANVIVSMLSDPVSLSGGGLNLSSASTNVSAGIQALPASATGTNDTAFGYQALKSQSTGVQNTAVGSIALDALTIGNYNTGIGYSALGTIISGNYGTGVGYNALALSTGGNNTGIGVNSGSNISSGLTNIAIGFNSGLGLTTGSNNVIIGTVSGLASSLAAAIVMSTGDGVIHVDYNKTSAANWKFNEPVIMPTYTVAALPTGVEGAKAYATNGRKIGEGAGAGTGVPVYFSAAQWRVYTNDAVVAS